MGKFIEETCFALNSMGECSALSETKCENCKFLRLKSKCWKNERELLQGLRD